MLNWIVSHMQTHTHEACEATIRKNKLRVITICNTKSLTFSADVHEGIPWVSLRHNVGGRAANHRSSMRGCV